MSGIMHSVFVLLFILVAAPLASYVPLAALAGLLATVVWNMAERHEFAAILARSRGEAAVLLVPWRSGYDGLLGGSAAAAGATVRMFFG
jgi:sulfate permease, SulP family